MDDVFDAALANEIISLGQDTLVRATVVRSAGGGKEHDSRTNDASVIDQWAHEKMSALVTKIASFVRLPPENAEPSQLLRYEGDQKFDPHTDAFDNSVGGRDFLSQGGQRLFTTICYLNDVGKGGETEFPALKIKVAPKLGRVLIFGNTRLGTTMEHPHSSHGGRPVEEGEKYALSIWWRQLAYHIQRDYPAEEGETKTVS
ncbi:2OG-Fe(II) oxygenase [Yoonia sp. GPGPB17]|uniref:prolyl hydroxylase family protein n=1 Tax=Yoonia sp. GPGPB17 TaxID=3026147 RepID=UPI0030BD2F75